MIFFIFSPVAEATALVLPQGQPWSEGKDPFIMACSGDSNSYNSDLLAAQYDDYAMHGLIEFDISSFPAGTPVHSATLELKEYYL